MPKSIVHIYDGTTLRVHETGAADGFPMVLINGAQATSMSWPGGFLAALGGRHRIVRMDTYPAIARQSHGLRQLADDILTGLDHLGIARVHLLGFSLGGLIAQRLMLENRDRVSSVTLLCTRALGAAAMGMPEPDPRLQRLWERMAAPGDAVLDLRVEQWRLLNGSALPFAENIYRRLERGRADTTDAHPRVAAARDLHDRTAEFRTVNTPTLIIEGGQDLLNPAPNARHLATLIPQAQLLTIARLGHVLHPDVAPEIAAAVTTHAGSRKQS